MRLGDHAAARVHAQASTETFTAEWGVKRPDGRQASGTLTIVIRSFATDADRDALVAAVKKGGNAARDLLASKGYEPAFGARPLKRAIVKAVQDPLAEELLAGGYTNGSTVRCDVEGEGFKFVKM